MTPLRPLTTGQLSPEQIRTIARQHNIRPDIALQHYADCGDDQVFENNTYIVIMRRAPAHMNPMDLWGLMWLSIRRRDGRQVRSWTDMQEIKNQLLGPEAEAFESFPAESRRVDSANQYHLFGSAGMPALAGFPKPQS